MKKRNPHRRHSAKAPCRNALWLQDSVCRQGQVCASIAQHPIPSRTSNPGCIDCQGIDPIVAFGLICLEEHIIPATCNPSMSNQQQHSDMALWHCLARPLAEPMEFSCRKVKQIVAPPTIHTYRHISKAQPHHSEKCLGTATPIPNGRQEGGCTGLNNTFGPD